MRILEVRKTLLYFVLDYAEICWRQSLENRETRNMLDNIVKLDSNFVYCQLSAIHRVCVDPPPSHRPSQRKKTLSLWLK